MFELFVCTSYASVHKAGPEDQFMISQCAALILSIPRNRDGGRLEQRDKYWPLSTGPAGHSLKVLYTLNGSTAGVLIIEHRVSRRLLLFAAGTPPQASLRPLNWNLVRIISEDPVCPVLLGVPPLPYAVQFAA